MTLTYDLWPPKSIGSILSPWFTSLQRLMKKYTTVKSLLYSQAYLHIQWWFVNPGSDNPEISLVRTKSSVTDFRNVYLINNRASMLWQTCYRNDQPPVTSRPWGWRRSPPSLRSRGIMVPGRYAKRPFSGPKQIEKKQYNGLFKGQKHWKEAIKRPF